MSGHLADHLANGHQFPGIFIVNLTLSYAALAEELWLAAYFSLPDEYRDQLRYLPLD